MNYNTRITLLAFIALTLTVISCRNDYNKVDTSSAELLEYPTNAMLTSIDSCNKKADLSLAAMNEQIIGTWRLLGLRCRSNGVHHTAKLYIYNDGHYVLYRNDVNIAYGTWQLTKDSASNYHFTTSQYLSSYLGEELKLCGDELTLYPYDGGGCLAYYKRD